MEHKTTHEEKQRQSEEAPLKVGWDVIHLSDLGISLRHRDGFPNTFLAKVFPLVLSQTRILSLLGRIKGFGILHYLKQKTCDNMSDREQVALPKTDKSDQICIYSVTKVDASPPSLEGTE